jgi:hypothetical protein
MLRSGLLQPGKGPQLASALSHYIDGTTALLAHKGDLEDAAFASVPWSQVPTYILMCLRNLIVKSRGEARVCCRQSPITM